MTGTDFERFATIAGELGERAKELEGSLLHMFGLKRRPRPGQQPVVVPEFLVELYRQQTGLEVDTTNLNLAGKHTQTANTVRTFTHKGASLLPWCHIFFPPSDVLCLQMKQIK